MLLCDSFSFSFLYKANCFLFFLFGLSTSVGAGKHFFCIYIRLAVFAIGVHWLDSEQQKQ